MKKAIGQVCNNAKAPKLYDLLAFKSNQKKRRRAQLLYKLRILVLQYHVNS